MDYLRNLRSERESIGVSLDTLAALSGVSASALSRFERGLQKPSDASVRLIHTTMTSLQHIRMQRPELRLAACEFAWLREQVAEINEGKDSVEIARSGEGRKSKRIAAGSTK